eukprot:jgi/Chlat1/6418/Chrsp45S06027
MFHKLEYMPVVVAYTAASVASVSWRLVEAYSAAERRRSEGEEGLFAVFLGKLTIEESHKLAERLINYVLFKMVFMSAVVENFELLEVMLWTSWFSVLGFLKMFAGLSRDRFERLCAAPGATVSSHVRTLALVSIIFAVNLSCVYMSLVVFSELGWSKLLLLLFEAVLIAMDCSQTLLRYGLHLAEAWHMRPNAVSSLDSAAGPWEWRGALLFHIEFAAEVFTLLLTLLHYMHIWCLHGISFQLIDAVLFLNIRAVVGSLRRRVKGFLRYRKATQNLRKAFPDATNEQLLVFNDDCAICKERMSTAKRLPCGHLFHLSCLRSWLEQSVSNNYTCPTCRASLTTPGTASALTAPSPVNETPQPPVGVGGFHWRPAVQETPARHQGQQSQTAPGRAAGAASPARHAPRGREGWWSTFSMGLRAGLESTVPAVDGAPWFEEQQRLSAMVVQVREMLPGIPDHVILQDLRQTMSAMVTVNNLLDAGTAWHGH